MTTWKIDFDADDVMCECGHANRQHEMVFAYKNETTFPCSADDHFDADCDGRMMLVEEPCICENFTEG